VSKLVYGVGVSDADYQVQVKETISGRYKSGKKKQKGVWACPFYRVWVNMLQRGYSEKLKVKRPTYRDCTVCEEWHLFSKFRCWMETQDWEGKELDKDLLIQGNKVYSPETCVFVSAQVNSFMTDSGAARGQYKIGVSWHKIRSKYQANCNNPFTHKKEYLGLFETEDMAHQEWLARKLEHAYVLAATQTDERIAEALIGYYENYGVNCEYS